jgi:hypothetical protein
MPKQLKHSPEWQAFEKQVASLLHDFGYSVEHDTKVQGAQTDVFARSNHPKVPNLLVECKYHEREDAKVRIDEVENFMSRVINLRNAGEVDRGYLVTNTGFTADAKGALVGPPARFVFLVTYNQFLAGLVNADSYLRGVVEHHSRSIIHHQYVPLRTVDTTAVDGTIFDAQIGAWASRGQGKRRWILPASELSQLIGMGCASRDPALHAFHMEWTRFEARLEEAAAVDKEAEAQRKCVEADQHRQLLESIEHAKRAYAESMAKRLGKEEDAEVMGLLMEAPPTFSPDLLRLIAPRKAPPNARAVWDRCRKEAFARKALPAAPAAPVGGLTENSSALAREERQPLQLLPMGDALQSLQDFLSDPEDVLYVLLGDYGAGKSTIVQRFMWQLADCKLKATSEPAVRIPLLLNLRDYNKVADFATLIRAFLSDEADMRDLSLSMFRKLNAAGYFVLLLDGFDEMLARVTKPDRRRCFLEIAQFLAPRSKVILAGRPGYFPDHQELMEVLRAMNVDGPSEVGRKILRHRINCLQLMDGHELNQFLELSSTEVSAKAKTLIEANPSLYDLARRPVLSGMIMVSANDLAAAGKKEVTVRELYQVYTDKWVTREEDKGEFRLLIDPEKKSTFMRYLAMEMHLRRRLSVSYKELGEQIQGHFHLTDVERMDHFGHDIRTCSFLNRSDNGEYRFIHKSFMEFFVACEFERLDDSPFAERFDVPLNGEMIAFLETKLSLQSRWSVLDEALERIGASKENAMKNQSFEGAASWRDVEKFVKEQAEKLTGKGRFGSMRKSSHSVSAEEVARWDRLTRDGAGEFQVEGTKEAMAKVIALLQLSVGP